MRYKVVPYFDGWAIVDTTYIIDGMVAFPYAHKGMAELECEAMNAKHDRMLEQTKASV